jgi:hypothetical protein
LISIDRSTAFLPEAGSLRRLPRGPQKHRPAAFHERFEDRALVYDCFWHADGQRILLIGPPPMNLQPHNMSARYVALPSNTQLSARYYPSLSTMITELVGAPAGTTAIRMEFAGTTHELPVGANHSDAFAGRRVLFTMSKDNELGWIAEWARWHARLHGTDAIVLFDNGSSRYTPDAVAETLLGIEGIERVVVPAWPWRFGMTDRAVLANAYWSHFLQISSMSVVLRRFGAGALGLLNCDVDELAATRSGRPIYDHLADARHGLVVFRGLWIEPSVGSDHRAHIRRLHDPHAARSRQKKWVLDPRRAWVQRLAVHPYWHWVRRRPAFGKTMPADAFYRHFKAINTNWKEHRTAARDGTDLVIDEALVADFARSNSPL